MIEKNLYQKIIDETDIVEVINEYVPLHPEGSSMKGLCPFHDDKNPSLSVSPSKKVFNCFSCNAKGTVINFVSRYESITNFQAAVKLAKRLGINVNISPEQLKKERLYQVMNHATDFYQFYLFNSTEGQQALTYLNERGITNDIISKFKIGLASNVNNYLHLALNEKQVDLIDQKELGLVREKEDGSIYDVFRTRIIFPLTNNEGQVVGFSGRVYLPNDKSAKYINSQETVLFHKSDILYNYHAASIHAKRMDKIYVFEGFMDVIAADKVGINNVVATMGTAMTKEHVKSLISLTNNIILCFDGDEAGIIATKRAVEIFAPTNISPRAIALPDGLDPDDFLKKYGPKALEDFLNQSSSIYEYLYERIEKDLLIDDLSSIQKYKKEVFNLINISRSNTIKDFFLKRMATKLGIEIESLNKDFDKKPIKSERLPKTHPTIEGKEIKKGVIKALEVMLHLAMKSKDNYFEYIQTQISNITPELFNYFHLFKSLSFYYQQNDEFSKEKFLSACDITDDETIKIIDDSLKTIIMEDNQVNHIKDCLKRVGQYQSKMKKVSLTVSSKTNDELIPALEEHIKSTVKVLKGDD